MSAKRRSEDDRITKAAIAEAVRSVDLADFPRAWSALDILSNQTTVDAILVEPAGISIEGDRFRGLASVQVALHYGGKKGAFTASESFLGEFRGKIVGNTPSIEEFDVDTTPYHG